MSSDCSICSNYGVSCVVCLDYSEWKPKEAFGELPCVGIERDGDYTQIKFPRYYKAEDRVRAKVKDYDCEGCAGWKVDCVDCSYAEISSKMKDYSNRDEVGNITPEYYDYEYKGIKLDLYRIFTVYGITCPALQHAAKKIFRCGKSIKDEKQDTEEVIKTLKRKLEMIEEDK